MNLFLAGIIIFVIIYLFLNWFAKTSSKKIAQFLKRLAIILSIFLSYNSCCRGEIFIFNSVFINSVVWVKIKGLTALQMFQLWRLIQYIRNSGKVFAKSI